MTNDPSPFERSQRAQAFFATKPTALTRFLRTSIPWQMFRFLAINLKMVRIILKSHH
ncbi:MAG: hypothetical protein HGA66_06420 [Holophaga sp.]|nr:hypothetical protein [Holophaga sp.]